MKCFAMIFFYKFEKKILAQLSLKKFMLSKMATKIDKIFNVDLTLCRKCQIDGEDFVNFYGLLGKHKF